MHPYALHIIIQSGVKSHHCLNIIKTHTYSSIISCPHVVNRSDGDLNKLQPVRLICKENRGSFRPLQTSPQAGLTPEESVFFSPRQQK